MENQRQQFKGAHPLFTMMFYGGLLAVLVASGSYVSKQKSLAREVKAGLEATAVSVLGSPR